MVLDSNLFTLSFQRRPNEPNVVDLVPFTSLSEAYASAPPSSSAGNASTSTLTPTYTFSRAIAGHYSVQLLDSLTNVVLASIECPSSNDKAKTISLFNPNADVLLEKKANTFRQDWRWSWQNNDFLIRRDGRVYVVEALRKPDPEIDVARYTPATKTHRPFLQLLDYNIQRLEIQDLRGLEILAITACLHCIDQEYDEKHRETPGVYSAASSQTWLAASASASVSASPSTSKLSAADSSKASLALEPNEMLVDLHVADEAYIEHAINLLRQDEGGEGLHMVVIRAQMAATTIRAVRIAAAVKARWYKLSPMAKGRTMDPMPGSTSEIAEELYQYVRDPAQTVQSSSATQLSSSDTNVGPRGRIRLDSPIATSTTPTGKNENVAVTSKKKDKVPFSVQAPPDELAIYLSKDRIDEFEPNRGQRKQPEASTHSPSPQLPPPSIPPKTHGSADVSGVLKRLKKWGVRPSE